MRDTQDEILYFWFEELAPSQWFQSSAAVDADIRERFLVTHEMAADGLCNSWAVDAEGSLALIIVLDQFPRHMFRGEARAFATDEKALLIAKQAVHKGFDQVLEPVKRGFLYLPFQHSEVLSDQGRSVELFGAMAEENPAGDMYARRHYVPIEKFGRFPHRNQILGRQSTPEEIQFLKENSGFL
ncbi:MAG: DUF924 domain-containing protein [Alphaproteobacteria bacterium]|nr:DUF924 domain-containing protein [Alphaproteobacteria bacterium]